MAAGVSRLPDPPPGTGVELVDRGPPLVVRVRAGGDPGVAWGAFAYGAVVTTASAAAVLGGVWLAVDGWRRWGNLSLPDVLFPAVGVFGLWAGGRFVIPSLRLARTTQTVTAAPGRVRVETVIPWAETDTAEVPLPPGGEVRAVTVLAADSVPPEFSLVLIAPRDDGRPFPRPAEASPEAGALFGGGLSREAAAWLAAAIADAAGGTPTVVEERLPT